MWIYKITNDINNKVYIGQSIKPVQERFKRHIQDAISGRLNTHFAKAIRKYGKEHFHIEVIDIALTQEELTEKEYYWIEFYDSVNKGYNETHNKLKCGGNTYLSKTEEEMGLIKEKIRQTKLGEKNPRHERVKAINIKTKQVFIFGSMCECARELGFSNHICISRRCRGKVIKPYKEEWLFEYYDE